jgi:hypothetical protein
MQEHTDIVGCHSETFGNLPEFQTLCVPEKKRLATASVNVANTLGERVLHCLRLRLQTFEGVGNAVDCIRKLNPTIPVGSSQVSQNHTSRDPESPADEGAFRLICLEPVDNHQGHLLQKILRLSPIAHEAANEPTHRRLSPGPLDRHASDSVGFLHLTLVLSLLDDSLHRISDNLAKRGRQPAFRE